MKNFERHRTKFGMTKMLFALALGAALAMGFTSCEAETEYIEGEVPTEMTSHDATAVYHWKQNTNGVGYTKLTYEENDDGTTKTDEDGNNVAIETAQTVAAGTKLSTIAKTFYGFTAKRLAENLQADGTYAVNVYYERNRVTITVSGGVAATFTGLYGSGIDFTSVNAKVSSGYFIASSDIPATYPAEDKNCTVTLKTANIDSSDGFVKIPKGSFKRATSRTATAYTITLTKDFYMCDHQVTQSEWEKYMTYYGEVKSKDSYRPTKNYGKGTGYPAYKINWYEAVIYCNLLSIANDLPPAYYIPVTENGSTVNKTNPADWVNISGSNIKKTDDGKYYYYDDGTRENSVLDYEGTEDTDGGIMLDITVKGYRLPTEAEWEYAALGDFKDNDKWNGYGDSSNTGAYVFAGYDGTNADGIGKYAWYYSNSNRPPVHAVKGKLPNSYGLYDMSGNVCEWCYDWDNSYATSDVTDPTGSPSGSSRVICGGAWSSKASLCSVSDSDGAFPVIRGEYLGFRVVRSSSN